MHGQLFQLSTQNSFTNERNKITTLSEISYCTNLLDEKSVKLFYFTWLVVTIYDKRKKEPHLLEENKIIQYELDLIIIRNHNIHDVEECENLNHFSVVQDL